MRINVKMLSILWSTADCCTSNLDSACHYRFISFFFFLSPFFMTFFLLSFYNSASYFVCDSKEQCFIKKNETKKKSDANT